MSDVEEIPGHGRLRIDVLQVPLERLALEIATKLNARAHVSGRDLIEAVYDLVEVVAVLVRPHVDETTLVLVDHFDGAARERVRRLAAENMTHVRAWMNQEYAAAHPDLFKL